MPAANTVTAYGNVTKTFHWLTALTIFAVIPLGLLANDAPFQTNEELANKAFLFSLHKTLGVMIFLVALARIIWAITQTKPSGLHPDRKLETMIAEVVHWLLYVSLVAVPLTGWIHHAATTGFAPILLPIGQSLPFIPKNEGLAEIFSTLHWLWSKVMIASILLHVAGAIKHQIIDKDATLRRMWFGASELPTLNHHTSNLIPPLAAVAIFAIVASFGAATGLFKPHEQTVTAELDAVTSEWAVTDGTIGLTVTQFGNPVSGQFNDWTSAITFDPDAAGVLGNVTTTIAIGSLQLGSVTDQAMGSDFFDLNSFPTATFAGEISRQDESYVANGTLTIKGISVPVTLPFTLTIDGDVAVMTGQLALDRRDFEVGQTMSDETNLGFGVSVQINLTAARGAE